MSSRRKRCFSIIIASDDPSRSITFRIKRWLIGMLGGLALLLLSLIAVGILNYGQTWVTARRAEELKAENDKLRKYQQMIVEIEGHLNDISQFKEMVVQLAGMGEARESVPMDFPLSEEIGRWRGRGFNVGLEPAQSFPLRPSLHIDGAGHEKTGVTRCLPSIWPMEGWVTVEFGEQLTVLGEPHRGIDIAAPEGTVVKSTADGTVAFAGWHEYLGFSLIVDHPSGISTLYGHNSRLLVDAGERVRRGDVIALSGNTGKSSAPHLHYEVQRNGIPVNPRKFIFMGEG